MNTQDDIKKVTFQECMSLLTISWNSRIPMLIVGPPATAKTYIARDFQTHNDFDLIVTTGATSLPTDVKGMPVAEKGIADFIPFGDLRRAIEAKTPTLWVLEDFTNSDKDVQKGFMQLIHERQVNEHKISDYVHIIATGNRREDKSGVTGLLEAVKTRFGMVVEIVPDLDGWLQWAIPNNIHADVTGFLRFMPEKLYVHNPSNDMNREPNLRMWQFLSDHLHELDSMQADENLYHITIQATAGVGLGQDFMAYRDLKNDLPDIDYCLENPDTCSIPEPSNVGVLFAFNSLLARKCTIQNIGRIVKIANRLTAEFSAKLIFDCKAACPEIIDTSAFHNWSGANRSNILDI